MIRKQSHGLVALHKLLIEARRFSYLENSKDAAILLDEIELLPQFLASRSDYSDEFRSTLQSVVSRFPMMQYIVDKFDSEFSD